MVILAESGISLTDCASNSLQELELTFKKMAEMGNTQDLWDTDYPMPLTPPLSPITSFESTSSMSTDCDCHRFQPIYPSFNDVCNPGSVAQKFDSMVLKDCMWGFAKPNDTSRQPTAQLSNSVTSNAGTCFENTKLIGVDPTEVFPPSLFERVTNSDFTDSDDDSDVDVVTVDTDSDPSDDFDNFSMLSPPRSPESGPEDLAGKQTKVNFIIPIRLAASVASVPKDNKSKVGVEQKCSTTRSSVQRKQEHSERSAPRFKRSHHLGLDTMRLSRASHNVLERRRRNELKQKFYSLRDSLPESKRNDKVPKVTILRNAIDYISNLQAEGNSLDFEVVQLRKSNAKLKQKLLTLLKKQ